MPENEKPVNVHWLVGIPGEHEPLVIWAAYIAGSTVHAIGDTAFPVVLKDADHKIVFQGHGIQYVRRFQPGIRLRREDGSWTIPEGEG